MPPSDVAVKIGGDQGEIIPRVSLMRWGKTLSALLSLPSYSRGKFKVKNGKTTWSSPEFPIEAIFYDKGTIDKTKPRDISQTQEWTYEQEVMLEQPETSIQLAISHDGMEYRKREDGRHEFYHRVPLPDGIPEQDRQDYELIEFCLNPVQITDASGKTVKVEPIFDRSVLTITIPEGLTYPISIDPSYTVASGVNYTNATAYAHGRKLGRSSDGALHAVWTIYSTKYKVYYGKSTDEGVNWATTQLSEDEYQNYFPSIAVDSNDYLHVAWYGRHAGSTSYYQIRYIKYTTSWGSIENLTSASGSQLHSVLIWAKHGPTPPAPTAGYAFIWTDVTGTDYVKYYASSDLSWSLGGWSGTISGVTNPAKIMGVDKANIAKVKGVA